MSFYTPYRWCMVSNCNNSTSKTPKKLFIRVPKDTHRRNVWLELSGRDPTKLSTKSTLHVCEDHFNLEFDMENYTRFKIMGSVKKIKMKPNAVPFTNLPIVDPSQAAESTSTSKHLVAEANSRSENHAVEGTSEHPSSSTSCGEMNSNNTLQKCVTEEIWLKEEPVFVKEEPYEPDPEYEQKDSVTAAVADLYVDHEIKQELVLGPVQLLPQDVAFSLEQNAKENHVQSTEQLQPSEAISVKHNGAPPNLDYKHSLPKIPDSQFSSCWVQLDRLGLFSCRACDGVFHKRSHLDAHLTDRHTRADTSETDKENCEPKLNFLEIAPPTPDAKIPLPKIPDSQFSSCWVQLERLGLFSCRACAGVFHKRSHLDAHYINQHTGGYSSESDKENCEPKATTEQSARSNDPCNISHEKFAYESNTQKLKHSGKDMVTCDCCETDFATKNQLIVHMVIHCNEKSYGCDVCMKRFTHKTAFMEHLRIHTVKKLYSCDSRNEQFDSKRSLNERGHVHAASGQVYRCELCKKVYTDQSSLKRHVKRHTRAKRFSCDVCEKRFGQKSNLVVHMRVHTGEKPFSCDICGKQFSSTSSLNSHKIIHAGDKRFSCQLCEKKFNCKTAFKNHVRIHNGEQWYYSCATCSKQYIHKSSLRKHVRVHTGEKPSVCEIRKAARRLKARLNEHNRIHTNQKPHARKPLEKVHVCEICNAAYGRKSHLTRHKQTHTGQKKYACDVCKKSFMQTSDLKVHYRIHTGEKPYACEICKKSFHHKSNLTRHTKVAHG